MSGCSNILAQKCISGARGERSVQSPCAPSAPAVHFAHMVRESGVQRTAPTQQIFMKGTARAMYTVAELPVAQYTFSVHCTCTQRFTLHVQCTL